MEEVLKKNMKIWGNDIENEEIDEYIKVNWKNNDKYSRGEYVD